MTPLHWVIIIGIPILISLVVLENFVAKKKQLKLYTLSDSITNLSCGLLERVFDIFFSVLALYVFNYIYFNIAPFQIELSVITWIIGLFVTDFIAYWFHRLSHEINFLWAAHIVHHQSEELNLTTVFRVSFLAVIYRACFFVWMALAGFDVFTIVTTSAFLGFYQLFTHSRVIGKLGFLEKFLTTPSHHRVHHARNEKYMDRNYAHIFIFWDRLFGSFKEEEEEPDYGITSGFERANPFRATFSYWRNLIIRAKRTKKISDKIKVFTKGPKWTPKDVDHLPNDFKEDENGNRIPHKIPINNEKRAFILLNVLITACSFIGLLFIKSKMGGDASFKVLISNRHILSLATIIIISVFAHSRLIEQKKFTLLSESLRLLSVVWLTIYGFTSTAISPWLIPLVTCYCLLMFLWLLKIYINPKRNAIKA